MRDEGVLDEAIDVLDVYKRRFTLQSHAIHLAIIALAGVAAIMHTQTSSGDSFEVETLGFFTGSAAALLTGAQLTLRLSRTAQECASLHDRLMEARGNIGPVLLHRFCLLDTLFELHPLIVAQRNMNRHQPPVDGGRMRASFSSTAGHAMATRYSDALTDRDLRFAQQAFQRIALVLNTAYHLLMMLQLSCLTLASAMHEEDDEEDVFHDATTNNAVGATLTLSAALIHTVLMMMPLQAGAVQCYEAFAVCTELIYGHKDTSRTTVSALRGCPTFCFTNPIVALERRRGARVARLSAHA